MAFSRVVWFIALAVVVDASLYDDDYDTYTKAYDYRNAGNYTQAYLINKIILLFLSEPNAVRNRF